ncbi:hypothetical protein LZZ85_08030 [Terrimonas sp. NA20]|uniref:Uncharacterized protein n=1 Tax=Terrimonas ginsenosidimutans TaxID=2908004 RepID=A0ABS9KPG3_9BACT|nr:hypothetical protein [Terrimonas ginsenosidimutans]MCG2614226.1 hypothetical protein [Terrimonas ginsenosidimutans]
MIFKRDNLQLGLILGLLGPVLGLMVIYLASYSSVSLGIFLESFFSDKRLLTPIGSLSLLANVALFTIFVNTRRDKTAKGIFVMTVIFGIAILILKVTN